MTLAAHLLRRDARRGGERAECAGRGSVRCRRGVVLDGSGLCARSPPRGPRARAADRARARLGCAQRGGPADSVAGRLLHHHGGHRLRRRPGWQPCCVALAASPPRRSADLLVPVWAYLGAAVLALAAAVAIMPKVGIDGVAFAPPIFDHSKVALIDEMTRLGLPPGNPFFGAVGEPASRLAYYYLWHFSAAELALLTGASGWEADIAMTWFTAFSSLALMLGLANWFGGRATARCGFCCSTPRCRVVWCSPACSEPTPCTRCSCQRPGLAVGCFKRHGCRSISRRHRPSSSRCSSSGRLAIERSPLLLATLVLLAVAGYESSTWIGGVLFPVAAAMAGGMLLIDAAPRRRMSFLAWCAAAAILAICLAWPLLHDQFLATGMRAGGSPIAFRPFEVLGHRLCRWVAPYSGFAGVLAPSPADRISRRLCDRRRFVVGLSATERPWMATATSGKRQGSSRCSRLPALCAPGCSRARSATTTIWGGARSCRGSSC